MLRRHTLGVCRVKTDEESQSCRLTDILELIQQFIYLCRYAKLLQWTLLQYCKWPICYWKFTLLTIAFRMKYVIESSVTLFDQCSRIHFQKVPVQLKTLQCQTLIFPESDLLLINISVSIIYVFKNNFRPC